jgi:signal transduction histidine kinase/CheY-like chemotaxis protein/PAS domain-containing protein
MRIKAAMLIMAIVFVFTTASFLLSISFTQQYIREAMKNELMLALDIADSLISTKIELLKSNAVNISAYLLQAGSTGEMPEIMASLMLEYPEFLSLAVLDQYGIIANYGLSACAWVRYADSIYLQKALAGEVFISSTHWDDKHEHFVIHIFVPISRDFVLSAAIPAMTFSNLIAGFKLWDTGNIFIVDEEATMIANVRPYLVYERHNFIEQARLYPEARDMKGASAFYQNMINTDAGFGTYYFGGQEHFCVYRKVSSANTDWRIGVAAPINESPLQNVQNGLLLASVMFLAIGVIVSILVSGAAIKPFVKIQEQAKQLQDEHERARIMLNSTPFACRLWNKDYKIFECNDETVRLFEVKDKQEYIEHFWSLSPEYQEDGQLSSEKTKNILDKVFEEGRYVYKWMHQLPDGTPMPAEVTLVRVTYGGEDVIAGYTRDLREHEKMMLDIEKRDNLLNTMNRVAGVLLAAANDGNFEDTLMEGMELIGRYMEADCVQIWPNEIIDDTFHFVLKYKWLSEDGKKAPHVPIGMAVPYSETWKELFMRGGCINGPVSSLSKEDQELLSPLGITSTITIPLFYRDFFWGVFCVDDVIKERYHSESDIAILHSAALMLVNTINRNEMTMNLKKAADELKTALMDTQKANNAKSDFLASMSHEMRTPLNAVIGLSGLTLEGGGIDKDAETNLEKINSAGETLLSLVNDILDISKIEAGRFELIPGEYETPSLINDTVTNNILRIGEKPIEFILNIRDDLPARLYGDELRIKQILSNLLSNAFKYTRQGTVELGMNCTRENDIVWLTAWVRDSGIGIKAEDIGNLFFDYAQMDTKSNRKIEGTGLGLPIAKKMTELMGGTITVESEYGKGSTFILKIKQKYVNDTTIGAEVANSLKNFRYSNHKRSRNAKLTRIKLPYARVLVVDDNATNLDVAKGLMKPYGMQIDTASSGQQAIDVMQMENVKYNAIFMDHMMPGMDGTEATQKIRELGTDYAVNIPIIALTANAIAGSEKMFLSKGFQDFLTKPIDISRLDAVIRHWVRDNEQGIENSEDANELVSSLSPILNVKIDGIDLETGLERFGGDDSAYLQVLRSYAANTRSLLDSIKDVNKENLNDYAITVHGIKGSSRSVCAEPAGDIAEALEKAAKEGNIEYVSEKTPDFMQAVIKLLAGLDEMFARVSAAAQKPKKNKPDKDTLVKILEACYTFDMETVKVAIKELEGFEYETNGEIVSWLWENVQQFNIDEIIGKLTGMNLNKDYL